MQTAYYRGKNTSELRHRQTAGETVRLTGAPVRTLGHRVPVAVENRRPVLKFRYMRAIWHGEVPLIEDLDSVSERQEEDKIDPIRQTIRAYEKRNRASRRRNRR